MSVIGVLCRALANFFNMFFSILFFILIVRVIMSWFSVNPYNDIVQIIYKITEPILRPFRKLPLRLGPLDFSPMIAFMVLWFIRDVVVGILYQWSYHLLN